MKSEVCKRKDTLDELLARILDAAARKMKREDQLRRTTRDLHTRVVKSSEADRVHSFSILSDDRSKASSKMIPPHSAI